MTKLRADGYDMSPDYAGADVVLVNTCGFLDSAPRKKASRRSARPSPRTAASSSPAAWARKPRSSAPASRTCSRSPARSNMRKSSPRSTRPRRRSPTPSSTWSRREAGPQADPAPLQLFEDFRGLQPPLRLLHHPVDPRRPRQPPPRRHPARGREAGRRRHQGTAGHQPGHVGLWRRPAPRRLAVEGRRSPRPHDRPRPRARHARTPDGDAVGPAPLRLPLPARRPRHPADGRGAGPPLPRHPVPARHPQDPARDAPPGQ